MQTFVSGRIGVFRNYKRRDLNILYDNFRVEVSAFNEIITSSEKVNYDQLTIVPNPTNGKIYFNQVATYELYNMIGNKVASGNGIHADLSPLETGVYVLIINGERYKVKKSD